MAHVLGIALSFGSASLATAQGCGLTSDPNSAACTSAPAPQRTQPRAKQTENPRQAAEEGRGQFACAFYDQATNRCLTVRPNTRAYDDAVQTGIEAAMMGMQVQADALERARAMGIAPPPAAATLPTHPASPQASAGPQNPPAFATCMQQALLKIHQTRGRAPSQTELTKASEDCS